VISFIVPAYNEELLIGSTLDALHTAAGAVGEPYEVIVADDDSSDRTGDVAREHGAAVTRVKNRQIAATRNSGARIAKGDCLIFVDADTVVHEAALREALSALREGAAGGGAAVRFEGRVPLYGRALQWLSYRLYRLGKIASGSFMFCTRAAFDRAGGFDEKLLCSEEAVMSRALGRCGRFVVIKQTVLTSGRKFRMYSFREIMGTILRVAMSGGKMTDRESVRVWYDGKREAAGQCCEQNAAGD
jgi:glycosyltransferase involved in cell wall biosynthesis